MLLGRLRAPVARLAEPLALALIAKELLELLTAGPVALALVQPLGCKGAAGASGCIGCGLQEILAGGSVAASIGAVGQNIVCGVGAMGPTIKGWPGAGAFENLLQGAAAGTCSGC